MSERSKLDKAFVGGVAWTGAAKWISQLLSWSITIIVARLLSPSDYGIMGMASLYWVLVQLFSEFGLGTALVTLRDLTDDQVSQLNTVSLILGFVGVMITAGLAHSVGLFFRTPKLPIVLLVMSTGFVVSSFSTVPYSLLQKDLRFKVLAGIDALQCVIQGFATLILAYLGWGYWALVLGNLSVSFSTTIATLVVRRQRFAWPHLSSIRRPLLYSWHIIVGRLSWYGYNNSDFMVAGRVLGESPLGAYTFAWTLAQAPLEKLTTLVNRVTPGIYSAVQGDFAGVRRYLRATTEGLALIIFPATIGMALVAHDFVRLVLGTKWLGVALPLELLAVHSLYRSNVILLFPILNAIGEARFAMWNSLLTLAVLPMSFYIASRWGTGGIAAVWVVIYPFVTFPVYWYLFRKIQMPFSQYLGALWPALSGCVFMSLAVVTLKRGIGSEWPLWAHFVAEVSIGALAYAFALIALHRARMTELMGVIKGFRAQREKVAFP